MKRLDRMLNDVYRNGQMHYYTQTMSSSTIMKVHISLSVVHVFIK